MRGIPTFKTKLHIGQEKENFMDITEQQLPADWDNSGSQYSKPLTVARNCQSLAPLCRGTRSSKSSKLMADTKVKVMFEFSGPVEWSRDLVAATTGRLF